jgi:hypothetical protein
MMQYDMPWNPSSIKLGVKMWLAPYGFDRFTLKVSQDKQVVEVHCRKGHRWYLGTFHVSMLDNPVRQGGTIADWIESTAWNILHASWGHHMKT